MADFNKMKIPSGGLDSTLTEKQKRDIEKSGYLTDFQIFLPVSGVLEATSTCKHIKEKISSSKDNNNAAMWWLMR